MREITRVPYVMMNLTSALCKCRSVFVSVDRNEYNFLSEALALLIVLFVYVEKHVFVKVVVGVILGTAGREYVSVFDRRTCDRKRGRE